MATRCRPFVRSILIVAIAVAAGSCSTRQSTYFPIELQIRSSDVPDPLIFQSDHYLVGEGRVTWTGSYGFGGDDLVAVKHELTLFENDTAAQEAYSEEVDKLFPTASWLPEHDFAFSPVDRNDQSRFACLPASPRPGGLRSCALIQQHGEFISIVRANIDGSRLTFQDVERAIVGIDSRLTQWEDKN